MSNVLGSGRSRYWPASAGRLNNSQVAAAVGDRKVWKTHLVHKAPATCRKAQLYEGPNWTVDNNAASIIRNSDAVQFDNWMTMPEADGRSLIEAMKQYAAAKHDYWNGVTERLPWEPGPPEFEVLASSQDTQKRLLHQGKFLCLIRRWSDDEPWEVAPYELGAIGDFGFTSRSDVQEFLVGKIPQFPAPEAETVDEPVAAVPEPPAPKTREDEIDAATRGYPAEGQRMKTGAPYVRPLRREARMPDISTRERTESFRRVKRD